MTRYVAFLRAINTPPRYVKMVRLRVAFESLGYRNVATVIASGNVVFDTNDHEDLALDIEAALEKELGFAVPTFLRTAAELIDVLERQPFPEDEGQIEVSFLPAIPNPDSARALEATAAEPDHLAVIGREVYWWHIGPTTESNHSEQRVVRMLGMPTTRRALRTIRRIKYLHLS